MSEWNRYGRDDQQRRFGSEARNRRDARQDDSYGQYGDWRDREGRSFADRGEGGRNAGGGREQRGYARDDYARGEYGRFGGQERYGQGREGDRDSRRAEGGYGQRGHDEGGYSQGGYSQGAYGGEGRGYGRQDHGAGGQPRYGQDAYGGEGRFQGGGYGSGREGFGLGEGQHRGRGPKNYMRSDERIREDVNDRLSDDSWLDAAGIEVQVQGGEVTLSGEVREREDKRRAEDLAERVTGVRHVQNNLRVQPQRRQDLGDSAQPGQGHGEGQQAEGRQGQGQQPQAGGQPRGRPV